MTTQWTQSDELSALKQGWSIFTLDDGSVAIQKMDDPSAHHLWTDDIDEECPFVSDTAAIAFVKREATRGNETALKALGIVGGTL